MTSITSNSGICQEFVQNAWKKDLCSNCFKTRTDHHQAAGVIELSTSVVIERDHVEHLPNGFGKRQMKAKQTNGGGVNIWEVGGCQQRQRPQELCVGNGDIKGILKDKRNSNNNNNDNVNNENWTSSGISVGRRSSVVGFSENNPQVIGYGGHDYEWDDDQESSDEPSDVDSLENFDLSLEEKAFSELTDSNTQYNAENLNLSKLDSHLNGTGISKTRCGEPESSENSHNSYFPLKLNGDKDSNFINDARSFICSNLYGASDDVEESLDAIEDAAKFCKHDDNNLAKVVFKPGCDTAPSSTGRRHFVRSSVQDLFNKEEPVTAAEFAAAAEKLNLPLTSLTSNSVCSPYGIVSISSISSKMEVTSCETPPSIPKSLPVSSPNDVKISNEKRPQTLSIQTNGNDLSLGKNDQEESFDMVAQKRANAEYEVVLRSCHYASANVSNGVATPPLLPNTSEIGIKSSSSSLPPTPLTSPYSSTAILKGIPSNLKQEEAAIKSKPPVTKPKPKIPAKPSLMTPPITPSPEPPSLKESTCAGNCFTTESPTCETPLSTFSNCDTIDLSLEMTKGSGPGSIESGKRYNKRPAPRPPTDFSSPQLSSIKLDTEEVKVSSPTEETKTDGQITDDVFEKNEIIPADIQTKVEDAVISPVSLKGSTDGSVPSLIDETSPYGVPNPKNSSPIAAINGQSSHRETSRDMNNKSKKSKFSLKKLLKFGSVKEDHNLENRRYKSERRSKLEIIHPIDLIQTTRTDLANVSTLPSSPDSSFGSNGSNPDRPVLVKMTTFGSPPISPGWINVGLSTPKENTDQTNSPIGQVPGHHGDIGAQLDEHKDASIANDVINIIKNKSHKDRPVRPPPPFRVLSGEVNGNEKFNKEEQEVENVDFRHASMEATNETGDKNFNGALDYANLGDIRTSMAPRKPGRWPSGNMMELSEDTNGNESYEVHSNADYINNSSVNIQSEVTYYAPTVDVNDDTEELYADQAAVIPSAESSQLSSLTSDSTTSSQSVKLTTEISEEKHKPTNGVDKNGVLTGVKIYERVVLKNGSLEKVYASSPNILSPTEPSNGFGHILEEDDEEALYTRRKSSRLSLRKFKTIVHKNLEDNYGAVVAANHQTLMQISEQITFTQRAAASKAKMLENASLRWSDFSLLEDSQVTVVGQKAFYSAVWRQQNLETTLMITRETICSPTQPVRNPCVLVPLAEFQNFIPDTYFAQSDSNDSLTNSHGTIWVMERMRVETFMNVAENLQLQRESDPEAYEREVCFILLQLINSLKQLQVLGIEEIEADLSDFILIMKNNEVNYRLVILPKSSAVMEVYHSDSRSTQEKFSLGRGALEIMRLLFQETEVDSLETLYNGCSLIAEILQQEKADSLSQAKRLLEYLLWGPANFNNLDIRLSESNESLPLFDQEQTFQRWLDLERANVLNNLIRTQSFWQIRLTIFEEYMLSFFVQTSAKLLREASSQLHVKSAKLA